MNQQLFSLRSANGLDLQGKIFGDIEKAKALVVLVHGVGEHYQRYQYVAKLMDERGICLIGYDQQGHGSTPGKRGVISSAKGLMDDISKVIRFARSKRSELPVFLYGHSLGALEVLYYGLTEQPELKGVIATSPPLDTSTISDSQKKLINLLKKILPNLAVPSGLDNNALSRDKQVVEIYTKDPLVHNKVSVRLGAFMSEAAEYILEHASEWTLPLYLAHGSADAICPIAGSEQFASKVTSPMTYRVWEGLFHETHNEPEKDQVITAMLDWIEEQLG